jgi:hypothetical protein
VSNVIGPLVAAHMKSIEIVKILQKKWRDEKSEYRLKLVNELEVHCYFVGFVVLYLLSSI